MVWGAHDASVWLVPRGEGAGGSVGSIGVVSVVGTVSEEALLGDLDGSLGEEAVVKVEGLVEGGGGDV